MLISNPNKLQLPAGQKFWSSSFNLSAKCRSVYFYCTSISREVEVLPNLMLVGVIMIEAIIVSYFNISKDILSIPNTKFKC